ncbi:prepilin peptidase [Arthrobacter oryzae]|uniref:Prepilin peptidase n=1 Tax=Arthrobacter oryzae TaxID=409290 RepID=A0A3N0BZP8_9MICC|nr:prepilin peptidase [Arthrobacter oryzae]
MRIPPTRRQRASAIPFSLAFIVAAGLLGLAAGPAATFGAQRLLPALDLAAGRRSHVPAAVFTGALFMVMAWRFGASWLLPALLFLSAAGVVLSRIDLHFRLLPNRLVIPALGTGSALLLLDAAVNERWANLVVAFIGSAATFVIYLVLALISPRGLGMGDVKFSAVLALPLGYLSVGQLVLGVSLGFLIGALVGGVLLLAGLAGRKSPVPFGPSMFAGCIAAVVFGAELGPALLPSLFT